jgi:hypothetical protein
MSNFTKKANHLGPDEKALPTDRGIRPLLAARHDKPRGSRRNNE